MRVDACTSQVKSCLQDDNRCGKDFTQCIGLDTESIANMCPPELLVACQENGEERNMTQIDSIIQGIYLGLDNALLTQCQTVVSEKMLELCGDTQSCDLAFADDDLIGTESLVNYKDNNGDFIIEGLISFGNVKVKQKNDSFEATADSSKEYVDASLSNYKIDINDYEENLKTKDAAAARVIAALQSTANKINQKINILAQDPEISMCVNGRDLTRLTRNPTRDNGKTQTAGRFPHLLDASIMAIINSGLEQANRNYSQKYNKMVAEAVEESNDQQKAALCAAMAMNPDSLMECKQEDENGNCIGGYTRTSPFTGLFGDSVAGISSTNNNPYTVRMVIDGAAIEQHANALSQGHGEFIQTDQFDNMLGRVELSSAYSPQNNTCTLTTTTINCDETEQVKTTDKMYIGKVKKGGATVRWNGLEIKGKKIKRVTIKSEHFQGVSCKKFNDPVVITNSIKM